MIPGRCRRCSSFCPLSFILGRVCRTARSRQGRAGFARRSGPLPARTVLQVWRGRKGGWSVLFLSSGKQASLSPILQTVTLAADVDGRRMMQQPVQNRGRDDRIAEDRTPVAVTFIGSKNDAAAFVASADQLEKDRRPQ